MRLGPAAALALVLLAGCARESGDAADAGAAVGEPVASFACGSEDALVDLDQTNLDRVADAFGETGIGAKVCALFAPEAPPAERETVRATLPDGRPVAATVRPASGNA